MADLEEDDSDIGLEADDKKHIQSNRQEWFKGEKGTTYRASLLYFYTLEMSATNVLKKKNGSAPTPEQVKELLSKLLAKRAEELGKPVDQLQGHDVLDLNTARFKKMTAHFNKEREGIGFVNSRLGKDGADADAVWKMLGDPKTYFSSLLLFYPTDRNGDIIKERLVTHWTCKPWRFASKIYERFHGISDSLKANDLFITGQDLTLKCTNTDYQNFDIDSAGKAIWRKNPQLQAKILEQAVTFYDKLNPFRELSTAELRLKLGLSTGPTGGTSEDIGTDEFNSLLSGV